MIIGQQIYLRPITLSDTDLIIKWRNSESVKSRFIYQSLFTRESQQEWMKTQVDTGKTVQMIICEKETNREIGSAYIRDIDRVHQKAEYGLFIGEDTQRGHGIGTEVGSLMLNYAFEVLELHRIYSRVLSNNIASLISAKRAGLREEGLFRDDVFMDGQYLDVVFLGALNPKEVENEAIN
ncbi:MAG: GNAT family protein [Lachnospiraceae bacterium]